jgi:hypothetical protein
MKIHYITPFSSDGNIGKEYNERISELPDDCYIVLRDGDTMFLRSDFGKHIEQIILDNPDYKLITCMTNRIGLPGLCVKDMFDEYNLLKHLNKANELYEQNGTKVKPCLIAPGMLMIFHKSVWQKVKFKEKSIYFDKEFSAGVRRLKMTIGYATGLYLLHLYRMGKENPRVYKKHLLHLI